MRFVFGVVAPASGAPATGSVAVVSSMVRASMAGSIFCDILKGC